MSLKPQDFSEVPDETAKLARRAFRRKKNPYLLLRDKLGPLFHDKDFAALYVSKRGRPAEAPAILAMVLILQFVEDLSDDAAAMMVASRLDWKYLLGLELDDPGFDASVLSEFRTRLANSELVGLFLERILDLSREEGLLKKRGCQRTDPTHVVGHVQHLNRIECVGKTFQAALNSLTSVAPRWLQSWMPEVWFERYGQPFENYRLPKAAEERQQLAETIGQDGVRLLQACYAPAAPAYLREIEAVEILRRVWIQQYTADESRLRWRNKDELPPHAQMICSPYETEVRYTTKRDMHWVGYKAHLTETCDPDKPHLITHVVTTPSTTADQAVVPGIHADLAAQELLPATHLVDAGYTDADLLVESLRDYCVDLVGPVSLDHSWQARAKQGYGLSTFIINWEEEAVTCPQGVSSSRWSAAQHPDYACGLIHVRFPRKTCHACRVREQCTRSKATGRTLTFLTHEPYTALQTQRRQQRTTAFWERYKSRGGVEGTLSQGVRAFGLRCARYRGIAKTHLQHVLTAAAMNLVRLAAWWQGLKPGATRFPCFMTLAPTPV